MGLWNIENEFDAVCIKEQGIKAELDIITSQRAKILGTQHWLPEYEADFLHLSSELADCEAWLVEYRKQPEVVAETAMWRALVKELTK